MIQKITTVLLVAAALGAVACNTVRGAGADVQSLANCTEDLMKQGRC